VLSDRQRVRVPIVYSITHSTISILSPILLPPKLRSLPWAPFTRFCYLAAGAYGVVRVGAWSPALLLAALVPLLPVVLHLSLVLPQRRPVTFERPYIFLWIYGVPVMAIVVPAVVLTFELAMGGHLGYQFAFTLHGVFAESSIAGQFAMAAGCFWLAALPAIQFCRAIRQEGWEGLLSRPITALFAIVCVPVSAGLGVCFLSLALSLPAAAPQAARAISLGIVEGAGFLATSAILALFPMAVSVSLFRSYRSLVWQPS